MAGIGKWSAVSPDDVWKHAAVQAVRHPDFPFARSVAVLAECARCGLGVEVPVGRSVARPCGRRDCGFAVVAPRPEPLGAEGWAPLAGDPIVAGGVEANSGGPAWQALHLPAARPSPPPPPRSGAEWSARAAELAAMAPDVARRIGDLPVGWFGILELAAHALDARGLGGAVATRQRQEKFGTMRWYVDGCPAALAVADWAQAFSALVCARDGTPDGRIARVGGWWITLGLAARADLARLGPRGWRARTDLYPAWARPER